jgi:hypothetical protein
MATVNTATDEELQQELERRAQERAAAAHQAAVDAAQPFAACGFGSGEPIGLTMEEFVAAMIAARNGAAGDNFTYATAVVNGLEGLQRTVGQLLHAETPEG